jgi:UDP-glucose 4-epimerase
LSSRTLRILVTGGAGFIGSHVVEAALARGHEVSVLDDLSKGKRENLPSGVPLHVIDLRDRDAVARLVAELQPHAVSHQAAQASVPFSVDNPRVDAEINVVGGINLLDACAACGVPRIVFASTGGAIYGEVAEGSRATEGDRTTPESPYGISKLAVEQLLAVYRKHRALNSIVLRYANVYGPRQDPTGEAGVVAIFASRALRSEPLRINARRAQGDAGCIRDYVWVGDVARANLLALEHDGGLPSCINIGSGEATETRALASLIRAIAGTGSALEDAPFRPGDLQRSVLDPTVCQRLLGELVPLAAGLERTVAWFRERG